MIISGNNILIIFLVLLNTVLFAQDEATKKKLHLVFYIPQYFDWNKNENNDVLTIGIYGCTDEMVSELELNAQENYSDGTTIKLKKIKSINEIVNIDVLYISPAKTDDFNKIWDKISNLKVLLITDGLKNPKHQMINFISGNSSSLQYEVNKNNILSKGLTISMRMRGHDGDDIILKNLFTESEITLIRALEKERDKVESQKRQLMKQKLLVNQQKDVMTEKERRVLEQRNKIAEQNVELSESEKKYEKLGKEVKELQKTVEAKLEVLRDQDTEIKKHQVKIRTQQYEVQYRTKLLRQLSGEVEKQQKKMDDQKKFLQLQNVKIEKQQGILYLLGIVLVLIIGLAFFIYRGYKIKKMVNKQLEEKNIAINRQRQEIFEQALQLEKTNKELEKLSIVASETDNAIRIMDHMGNYEWINDGYTRMYGLNLEQLTIRSGNIIGANTSPKVREAVYHCLNTKRSIVFESISPNSSADKNICAQITLTPILDESGNIKKLVAIDTDISKLKEAEAEIKQQKEEIEAQRDEIEVQRDFANGQRQKLTDSILYAKRIQNAILPPEENLNKILPDHFIYFKPRDIVSGDFYWLTQKENKIIIAVADSTGHGVPGAFMSMLGIAFLNEIVNKMIVNRHIYTLQANEILNELRINVVKSLHQTGKRGETNDGMDIALCIIDLEKQELQFAGAHNPLFLIRKDELIQIKGDNIPIGMHRKMDESFTNHEMKFEMGDNIYLFSDGYMDQIGGELRRKFNLNPFRQLLLENCNKPMQKQREAVERAFEEWRGNDGQIDDVLVVGIKLTIEKQAIFEPSKYNWKDKVILIAEDLELNYILLVNALEKTRIEIIRAKDGIEALEISKSNPRINLVLMDIDMPRMDGYEATRQIKRMRPKLPIIAQTALSMIDEKEKSAEAGCDDYIAKPIKLQSFLNTLSKFLDK